MTTEAKTETEGVTAEDILKGKNPEVPKEVPKKAEPVAEEATVTEVEPEETPEPEEEKPPLSFKTQEELDVHMEPLIENRAKSKKDTELAPLQQKVGDQATEITKLTLQLKERQEDTALDRLEAQQDDQYTNESTLPDFKVAQRDILMKGRTIERREVDQQAIAVGLEKKASEVDAFRKALEFFMPEDKNFLESINALADELLSVSTDSERTLVIRNKGLELRLTNDSKPVITPRSRPDSTITTTISNEDTTNMSARDLIAKGLKNDS